MLSISQQAVKWINQGNKGFPQHLLRYLRWIDLSDNCVYFYWSDGSGTVWDGGELKAHEL